MKKIRFLFPFIILSVFYFLGCAHVISKESRRLAVNNIPFQWIAQNPGRYKGVLVIWGGEIIQTRNLKEGSQIVVLQRSLGYSEEPLMESNSGGRFLVFYKGFLDPAIYEKGKLITVAGIIEGEKALPLDQINYSYPFVDVQEIHLWKQDELSYYYHNY